MSVNMCYLSLRTIHSRRERGYKEDICDRGQYKNALNPTTRDRAMSTNPVRYREKTITVQELQTVQRGGAASGPSDLGASAELAWAV